MWDLYGTDKKKQFFLFEKISPQVYIFPGSSSDKIVSTFYISKKNRSEAN